MTSSIRGRVVGKEFAPGAEVLAREPDALVVSRRGLSYQVAQLESHDWITGQRSADDERGVVTAESERVFAGHTEIVRSAFLDAIEPIELSTITAFLERIAGRLRSVGFASAFPGGDTTSHVQQRQRNSLLVALRGRGSRAVPQASGCSMPGALGRAFA